MKIIEEVTKLKKVAGLKGKTPHFFPWGDDVVRHTPNLLTSSPAPEVRDQSFNGKVLSSGTSDFWTALRTACSVWLVMIHVQHFLFRSIEAWSRSLDCRSLLK